MTLQTEGTGGMQSEAPGTGRPGPCESGEQMGVSAHIAGGLGRVPGEQVAHRKYFQNPDTDR